MAGYLYLLVGLHTAFQENFPQPSIAVNSPVLLLSLLGCLLSRFMAANKWF